MGVEIIPARIVISCIQVGLSFFLHLLLQNLFGEHGETRIKS